VIEYIAAAQQVSPLLQRMGGPKGLLGRAIGLGPEEVKAGAPWWAWLGIGALLGGVTAYSLRHKLERITE
jgi:hypothetical protein